MRVKRNSQSQKASRSNPGTFWEVIGEIRERRPDCSDAVAQEVPCLNTEYRRPHRSNESSQADNRVASIGSEDGSDQHGKWYVICCSHLAGECESSRTNQESKNTIGIVSRAVNPRDITEETVEAKGGASMSEVQ